MSFVGSNILAGASGQGDAGYKIERSLRFNSADSAYLNKTFSSSGNSKTFTISLWVKRSILGTDQNIFNASSTPGQTNASSPRTEFRFNPTNDQLKFAFNSTGSSWKSLETTAQFRDVSAWYHIVISVDTTQATASNRVKIYVNGIQQTLSGTYPDANEALPYSKNYGHTIGNYANNYNAYFDGYLADVHFIDGQALAPTDFAELDDDGIWQAKRYEGSYVTGIAETTGAKPIYNTTDNFGQVKGAGTRTDSNSSYLVLALPMDGSNGGTSFSDESANIKGSGTAKSITNANVTTSTSSSQFYGSSGDFSANSAKLTIGSSNDFAFGTGDFTIEWWMNFNSIGGTPYDTGAVNAAGNLGIFIDSSYFYVRASGTDTYFTWSSVGVSTGEWHHYSVVRDNGTVSIYLDGVSVASNTNNANITATTAYVGVLTGHGYGTNGYQQDLRVYKGLAKYTSNFTVPPKASNSFYFKFQDNSSDAALGTDSSGNNNDWTVNNLQATGESKTLTRLRFKTDWNWMYVSQIKVNGSALTTGTLDNSGSVWSSVDAWKNGSTGSGNETYSQSARGDWFDVTLASNIANFNNLEIYVYLDSSAGSTTNIFEIELFFADGTSHTKTYASNSDAPNSNFNQRSNQDFGGLGAAPAGNDSLIDTPTDYKGSGNNGGNYATLNPLTKSSSASTLTNGNLDFDVTAGGVWSSALGTIAFTTEKIYFETTLVKVNSSTGCNAAGAVVAVRRLADQANWAISGNDNYTVRFTDNGCYKNGAATATNGVQASGGNVATGDVIGFAIDGTNGTYGIYRNGVVQASGSIGITGYSSGDALIPFVAGFPDGGGYTYGKFSNFNFGQRPFAYTPPTGYKSLCTQNLADPTIADGSTAFDILTWTGDGSGARTVSGLNLSDAPDFVWSKTRNNGYHNNTWDSVRGYGSNATALITDYLGAANGGKLTSATASSLTFDGGVWHNENARTYVAWAWDAGSSNTSISAGGLNSSAYDQSQTWSGQVSGTVYSSTYGKTNGFSGSISNQGILPADGQTLTFTPSPSFSNAKTVKIYYYYPSSHADAWKINGTSVGNDLATTGGSLTYTFNVEGSGFTSLAWSRNLHGSEDAGVYAIEVDGKLLVDNGVTVKNVPTIATTVRANPNYGFSISKADVAASLTGGPTVAHGLNAKPDFIIGKNVDSLSIYWRVFHKDLQENHYLGLNRRDAEQNSSAVWGDNNSLDSNVFQIGAGTPASMWIPSGTNTCIFYAWSEVKGYSKFGSYTGNGSADGPFAYTGFTPKWIMFKNAGTAGDEWMIYDSKRKQFNAINNALEADTADSENASGYDIDILSNGFKVRNNNNRINYSGQKIIYAAFAERPFKSARAR